MGTVAVREAQNSLISLHIGLSIVQGWGHRLKMRDFFLSLLVFLFYNILSILFLCLVSTGSRFGDHLSALCRKCVCVFVETALICWANALRASTQHTSPMLWPFEEPKVWLVKNYFWIILTISENVTGTASFFYHVTSPIIPWLILILHNIISGVFGWLTTRSVVRCAVLIFVTNVLYCLSPVMNRVTPTNEVSLFAGLGD